MSLKKALVALLLCMLALSLAVGVHAVKADSISPITFAGGITLISPVNETYDSNYLTLNFNLTRGGIPFIVTFSVDGANEGVVPLTYNGSGTGDFQLFAVYTGTAPLPRLTNGSHQLTIYEEAYLNDYRGAEPPGAPFQPTSPGSDNYTASWTDTVYFAINATTQTTLSPSPAPATATPTSTSSSAIPELPWWVILPLLLSVFLGAVIIRHRKN